MRLKNLLKIFKDTINKKDEVLEILDKEYTFKMNNLTRIKVDCNGYVNIQEVDRSLNSYPFGRKNYTYITILTINFCELDNYINVLKKIKKESE